ncbi:MAG: hypothetical protein ABFD20_01350 [Anaerolineales bacterium]
MSDYRLIARVSGSAASGIEIWDREPAPTGALLPRDIDAADFPALTAPMSMSVADIAPSLDAVYTLRVGLYDQVTGERASVVRDGVTSDRLDLDVAAAIGR